MLEGLVFSLFNYGTDSFLDPASSGFWLSAVFGTPGSWHLETTWLQVWLKAQVSAE